MKAKFTIGFEQETQRHTPEEEQTKKAEIDLKARETFRMEGDQRGKQIQPLEGLLWITQRADPKDYVLIPGGKFIVDRAGAVVTQSLRDARLLSSSTGA
jgi:Protein of unknown function (DUF2917)